MKFSDRILFEDNHLLVINKRAGDLVQGDATGDKSLLDMGKAYIKEKYKKPGDVFLGLPHRLDRPTSGIVVLCRTSKSLSRMTELFKQRNLEKRYWAIVKNSPSNREGTLVHNLLRNPKQNKSYVHMGDHPNKKKAELSYNLIAKSERFYLLEIDLQTGRHHQIRAQLAHIGCPIKGDLKYGFDRSNKDGSISLHARSLKFVHPVRKEELNLVAAVPKDTLWQYFETNL